MSITNKLNQIKNAIYGKEVRGAIHDAIKQVYDDASVNHDNANMEVKMARGTHNTLNDRLDNVDEIQAQTNAQLSVINKIANTINFKEVLNNLTNNSHIAFESGNYVLNGELLVLENKKNITIDLSRCSIQQNSHGYGVLEIKGCENITIKGGCLIGSGKFPDNTLSSGEIHNEKHDNYGVWGFRRNGDSKSTTPYNGGWLGNAGIGLLIHQGCKNIVVDGLESHSFNFSGLSIGFRGNGDTGWGDVNNVIYSQDITVKNSYFHDNFSQGILLCQVDGFTIDNNRCENNGHPRATSNDFEVDPGYGITCTGTWHHAKNGFIKNNYVNDNKRKGIDIHAGENITISNNYVSNSFVQGISVVTNSPTTERLMDYKIIDNVIIDCGNGCLSRPINFGIVAQGEHLGYIRCNTVKDSAKKTGAYAIVAINGTKIISDNTIIDSGEGASIRNYGQCSVTKGNNISTNYNTAIMVGDSESVQIINNHINFGRNDATKTGIFINGSSCGIVENNSSNISSIISFGSNTSDLSIKNNNNLIVGGNIKEKRALVEPRTYTFKVFVNGDGEITYDDYSKNIIREVISNTHGMRINFNKNIKDVTLHMSTGDSLQANKIKNKYLRSILSDGIVIGLGATETDLGRSVTSFGDTDFTITMTTFE